MKANPLTQFLPLNFPSPINLPPATTIRFPPPLIPKATSFSTPNPGPGPISTNPPPSPDAVDDTVAAFWDYQFLFISQRNETEDPVTLRLVDGEIPTDFPAGTYYLTGPGIFSDDHGSTVHPLDGHGYLRAFAFNDNDDMKEVTFMAKYVKTEAKMEEHDAETDTWRFTHRGPFSVLKGGRKLGNTKVMKNVANTSVLRWGRRLLCLWEGGDPYEVSPDTLDTVGKFCVVDGGDSTAHGGVNGAGFWRFAAELLKPVLYGVFKMPPKRLLSHYKLDAKRNRLIIMSCNAEDMLLPTSNFTFYEFDSNFKLLEKKDFIINDHLMIHDWAFTDTHYILFANRIKLDVIGAMGAISGISPMISALSANRSKGTTPVYLLPRFGTHHPNRDWRMAIEIPSSLWFLHVGNAFQLSHDHQPYGTNFHIQIHASACSYQWFDFQKLFGYNWETGKLDPSIMNLNGTKSELLPRLVKVYTESVDGAVVEILTLTPQVSISLSKEGKCEECSIEPLNQWTKASDFPVINPKFSGLKNNYLYAASSSGNRRALPSFPFDMIVKLDTVTDTVRTWSAGHRRFVGEPIFVCKGDEEDDGYLIVVEYAVSIQRCYLIILEPKKIGEADAVLARFEVPKHLNFPIGFHGFWAAN